MCWNHRFVALILLALTTAGCKSGGGDVCSLTVELIGAATPVRPALVTDARGAMVIWSNQTLSGPFGVFARREGGSTVSLQSKSAIGASALAVEGGFFVCWVGDTFPPDTSGCELLDDDLQVVEASRLPDYGVVRALGRIGGQPFALAFDPTVGLALVPIDESGRAHGAPVPLRDSSSAAQFTDGGLVRLESNPEGCDSGTTLVTPSALGSCEYDLSVYTSEGRVLYLQAVAPASFFGRGQVAALNDRFLVTWNVEGDRSLTLLVHDDGSTGVAQEFPSYARPFALGDGFIVAWNEAVPGDGGDYQLLRGVRLDRDGVAARGPAWLLAPGGDLHSNTVESLVIDSTSSDFAMAWIAERGLLGAVESQAAFRRVACLDEEAPLAQPSCPAHRVASVAGGCPAPTPAAGDCDNGGGEGCFVAPSAAMTVEVNGTEQAPNWDCGQQGGVVPVSAMPFSISGHVTDLVSGRPIAQATVDLLEYASPRVTSMTDELGSYQIVAPAQTVAGIDWRVSSSSALVTYALGLTNDIDVTAASNSGADLPSIAVTTANAWATAVGRARDACEDVFVGRVLDCDGRPVRHVIATLADQGTSPSCPTFVPGTATYYFGGTAAPLTRAALSETGSDGSFVVLGLLPSTDPSTLIQVYGFDDSTDVASGVARLHNVGHMAGVAHGAAAQVSTLTR